MMVRAGAVVFVLTIGLATVGRASPWDDVAHPNRRRCAQLIDEATRLSDLRQWTGALQAARTAATLCPSDRAVLQSAGELLLAARVYPEARQRLEHARALAESAPATQERELSLAYSLGIAREVTGDVDGAIEEHRRLEAMGGLPSPNQYLVHDKLGDELMAVGRLGEAIEEYRRAAALAPPTRPIVRLAFAVALDRDEQIDQAHRELAAVLAFDPELRCLGADGAVIVPPQDVYFYRALALSDRGSVAEARLALRTFLAELPTSPYAAHARQRLAEAERHVDTREIGASSPLLDRQTVARALGPVVGALEDCLPAQRVIRVRLQVANGHLETAPQYPAAECLNHVLFRVDETALTAAGGASFVIPLAGRRAAASLP